MPLLLTAPRRLPETTAQAVADLQIATPGRVTEVFNTSTGTEEPYTYEGEEYIADTPNGQWEIYRQIDGWRESHLGRLWWPKDFHTDGIAIHGYQNVTPYRPRTAASVSRSRR